MQRLGSLAIPLRIRPRALLRAIPSILLSAPSHLRPRLPTLLLAKDNIARKTLCWCHTLGVAPRSKHLTTSLFDPKRARSLDYTTGQ